MKVIVTVENIYTKELYDGYADYDTIKGMTDAQLLEFLGYSTDNHKILDKSEAMETVEEKYNDDIVIVNEVPYDETT